ncbi:hypothetical protein GGR52DRAFT_157905 [Hypoxylon sp. FL1284]|nr:hypothetical protein GGR52DRAFT_157905 [Hypoxylon sp. FL1284]
MPTYLCHGFRWHRRSIRYFIVIQNVDDGASEWVVTPGSCDALLDHFYELFDFLPPCSRPTREPSPSSRRVQSRPATASNGHAHSRNLSYASQEKKELKEKQPRRENGYRRNSTGQHSQHGLSPNHNKLSGKLTKSERRNDTNTIPPPSELSEPDESIPFNTWSVVKFLEEFDPSDLTVVSGEWAYVADYVVRIDTSVSVADEISRYEAQIKKDSNKPISGPSDEAGRRVNTSGSKNAGWFEQLRDQLQRNETITWYVVVCGDEERTAPRHEADEYDEDDGESSASGQERRSSLSTVRGIIENGFEFRLPEFLSPARASEDALRRRRAERRLARRGLKPAPLPENDQPVIPPPPAPVEAAHKTAPENTVKPKTSRSSGALRRLFLRRKADGPT